METFRETLNENGVDRFRYFFYDKNLGSAGGQNALFAQRRATCDYIFVINPDIYLAPDVLGELMRGFDKPGVGIVEARQIPLEHPKAFDRVDGSTSWASGACMMICNEVLEAISGFDSDSFFLYCDDVDFSWRARLAGYRIVHRPSAGCVFHDKRLTSDGRMLVNDSERYYSAEAALMMAWKYSRPDLVDQRMEELSSTEEPLYERAVTNFLKRQESGTLPEPLDKEHRVAEFVGHYYGQHRFDVRV